MVIDGRVHSPAGGPGTIAGLPIFSKLIGGDGLPESAVSDQAVLSAARRLHLIPDGHTAVRSVASSSAVSELVRRARSGDAGARAVLGERCRVLGEAVALLRDLLNPAGIVVGGQAFTDYPEGFGDLAAAFATRSLLPAPPPLRMTAFGARVQDVGAGVVSLSGVFADPLAAMRRAHVSVEGIAAPAKSSA